MNIRNYCIGLIYVALAAISVPSALQAYCGPNQIRLGADVYYRQFHEKIFFPLTVEESGFLYGYDVGYDYLKANSIYIGLDTGIAWGKTDFENKMSETTVLKAKTDNVFYNVEGRFGYSFVTLCNRLLISPFLGIGYHEWQRRRAETSPLGFREWYHWYYGVGGVRSEYYLCNQFTIGLTLKLMSTFNGSLIVRGNPEAPDTNLRLGMKLQYEAELPLTYMLKRPVCYVDAIKLTPYYINRNLGQSNAVNFERDGGLYSTYEPTSESHVYGVRLEIVSSF